MKYAIRFLLNNERTTTLIEECESYSLNDNLINGFVNGKLVFRFNINNLIGFIVDEKK